MSGTVALNTTKRKFAKLLDNLTGSAPPSPAASRLDDHISTAPVPFTPSKRPRISDVGITSPERPSTSSSFRRSILSTRASMESVHANSVRLVNGQSASPRKNPNYAPWSQELFLERLKTFADVKLWTPKPDKLSEVEWAKRGWVLESWNKVACKGGCEQRVTIRLRPKRKDASGKEIEGTEDFSRDVEDELVERYADMIVDGHSELCLWRKGGCKNDIYNIPLARRDRCENGLQQRYKSLLAIAASLPPLSSITIPFVSPSTLTNLVTKELYLATPPNVTKDLPEDTDTSAQPATPSTPRPSINQVALAIAAFGWTGVTQESVHLLLCEHCFQRIGLWMYTSDRIASMSEKLSVDAAQLRLNVWESHREHCPWKNPVSQHNPPDGVLANLSASETLINTLKRTRRDQDHDEPRKSLALDRRSTREPTTPGPHEDTESVAVSDGVPEELSMEELQKQDKERRTKWAKLKARMSFKRPKSSGGKSAKSVKSVKSVKSTNGVDKSRPGTVSSRQSSPVHNE